MHELYLRVADFCYLFFYKDYKLLLPYKRKEQNSTELLLKALFKG